MRRKRPSRARPTASIAALALAFGACSADSGVTTEAANAIDSGGSGTLTWAPCDDPDADDETLECATLAVPLDYGAPDGSTIDLALVRVPAAGDREGAVLFNPGGPGGSGFEYIAQGGPTIATALGLDGLDLIGFDPRGVDRSNGIRCVDDATQDRFLYLDDTPDTPEEQALLDEADGMFVDGCLTNYGNTLRHYSTENTARDMDRIRAALGDEQISFLGISYGTYLGAVYATLFPERVRAMVLDSAYEPNGDTIEQQYETQLVGFEHAFDNWVAWCQAEPTCAFTSPDVGARWDALLQQLDDSPLTGDDGRLANQSTMDTATAASLYSESEWAVLAAALAGAEAGDPAGILALADAYSGRNPDGTFDTMFQSSAVIRCASGLDQQPPPDPEALAARLREAAPRFGKTITADDLVSDTDECGELVGDVTAFEIGYAGAGPIVVVGGTNDPATPLRWAQEMAVAMGPAARLVTFTGEGHGQLLVSTCVTDIEATLLTRLELPADGTVCDPDPPVGRPDWWDDVPTPEGMSAPAPLPALAGALGVTPALGYAEFRTTRLSAIEAADAYAALLGDAGFTELGRQELPLPDNVQDAWIAPNGDLLAVVALGPGALTGDELRGATSEVPPGTTVVLLIYLPQ